MGAAFKAIEAYIDKNPSAPDADDAYRWALATAKAEGLETQADGLAASFLKRPPADPALRADALWVRTLAAAKRGDWDNALAGLEGQLKGVRLREGGPSIALATALASRAQLAGRVSTAQAAYDRLASAFFLNEDVRSVCRTRQARLELVGKPAPPLGLTDLEGKAVELSTYAGRVVLVDFWATNCPPCLAEFPSMKRLYDGLHAKGFEIVGISLDDAKETVDTFRTDARLPWRLALSTSDDGQTRSRYGATTIPATFVIDRKGRIACVDVRRRDMRDAIETLVGSGD